MGILSRTRRSWLGAAMLSCMPLAAVGQSPAETGTLIVLNKTPATATFIDVASGRTVATVPTGRGPHELAVTGDGRWAVSTDYAGGNSLTVLDVRAHRSVRTIDLSRYSRPHGAFFLPGDSILAVTSEATGNVVLVQPFRGEVLGAIETGAAGSHMVAIAGDGSTLFTGNIQAGTVSRLDVRTSRRTGSFSVPAQPEAITVSRDGTQVWVGSNAEGRVSVVDTRTGEVDSRLAGFAWPYRILIVEDRDLVVIPDMTLEAVRFIDYTDRREVGRIELPGDGPQGLALAPDHRTLFLSLSASGQIAVIDLETRRIVRRIEAGPTPDGIGWSPLVAGEGAQAETHDLPLTPQNTHWGYYDASLEPVLRVRSGDRIRFQSLLARGLERLRLAGFAESRFLPSMIAVENGVKERVGAHPLTGPIYVVGAEPGDVLEVRLLDIGFLAPYGVSGFLPDGGTIPDDFPSAALRRFEIDTIAGTATMQGVGGVVIPTRPFFGSIGVAPPRLSGRIDSHAPGANAGNLDNKELVEGTTVFLPVHVEGALLSIGDGHAAQGDGEVSGTAIEASLYGTMEVVLHHGRSLRWPRAETPTHYISMGLHPDLDEAARLATREMVDFLVAEKGMARDDAYVLCSVALDLRVTQLVDGTKGVHGMLAKELFR